MKRSPKAQRAPSRLQGEEKLRARRNQRVDRQTRKLLGKHYAAKYRAR